MPLSSCSSYQRHAVPLVGALVRNSVKPFSNVPTPAILHIYQLANGISELRTSSLASCKNDRVIFVCDLSLSKDLFPFISRAKERCPFAKTKEIFDGLSEVRSSKVGGGGEGGNLVVSFRDHYRFAISTRG